MNRTFGKYILDQRIGVGGMGEVYRATKSGPEGFEVCVAIKLILPHLAREESFRRLFSREARLAALLKHPNIVNVNGFDIIDGIYFIEMEYIDGSDLATLLKSVGEDEELSLEESAYIINCAARGLDHAHCFGQGPDSASGIIHRDFNPHNVLISIEGEVKITDFGIARAALGGTAASGTLMGKLAYMSPEQVEGRSLDHRSDLFSLGITAYQLLTGQHPFMRASEAGTLRAIQEVSYRPISESAPSLPPALAETVQSLLSASPDDRPGSAGYVAETFEEYLKPACAKMLGRRVRGRSGAGSTSPEARLTGPTLAEGSKRRFAWPAVLIVLAAVTLIWSFKTGETPLEADRTVDERAAVSTVPAAVSEAPPSGTELPQATVLLKTDPAGARVREGDLTLGHTPLTITIPAGVGSRVLDVSMDRFEPAEISLTRDQGDNPVLLALTPLPTGTMRISAIPWARVSFLGEDMGVTPIEIQGAPLGINSLILSNKELGIRREVKVNVMEGVNPAFVLDMGTGKTVQSSE
jgi:serine/threonine-protein kinase